jgi:dTMP kinase
VSTAGRLVVLEGGDGSGKSTQARLLAAALRGRGVNVVETFEPGATGAGAAIRELLLHRPEAIDPVAEALLMAADRAQHVATEIAPALGRGTWVVCDRFLPSSLVYQGVVRGLGVDAVEELNRLAVGDVEPDVVILLDVDDVVAEARRGTTADRLEAEGAAFHADVRAAYRTLARDRGWVVVDGVGNVDEVSARVVGAVEGLLAG